MNSDFEIPWHRYGFISELAQKLAPVSPQFGKTVLQKITYLLQEVYGIPLQYRFRLYNYGPYSDQLASDLDLTAAMKGVEIIDVVSEFGGYQITQGGKAAILRQKAAQFLREHRQPIEDAIREFGGYTARRLELYTTIVFASHEIEQSGVIPSKDEVVKQVSKIKPQFSLDEIRAEVENSGRKGHIHVGS